MARLKELPEEIRSEYLDRGFSDENLNIKNINFDLEEKIASAEVDVETNFENSYETGGDNAYHWSAITAYRAVSQVAVGYICTELNMPKNQIGEIMQISSHMRTAKPINEVSKVPINIEFQKYFKRGSNLYGELNFNIADRSFTGGIRFAVDLQGR
ncbi:hypothetical protein GOV13_04255 [Candidatus Pacearchaeota archaeon]|nr:hypothetical protein [Candidatus Pacearchaeota archaeon]